jgi:hypothetical protein
MTEHGFKVEQEEDRVPGPRLTRIGVAAVVVTVVAIVVSTAILGRGQALLGGGPAELAKDHGEVAPKAIGMIEQTLLDDPPRGLVKRRAEEQVLGRYGWVDRAHGVAHIPIDRAKDLVIARYGGDAGAGTKGRPGGSP